MSLNIEDLTKEYQKKVNACAIATKEELEKASLELDKKRQRIEREEEEIEAKAKALQLEKEKMKEAQTSMEDVILLNVGGKSMHSTRKTLCQFEGSFLESMFSGRWDQNFNKDATGNILLNFDPQAFGFILRFLRIKELSMELTDKHIKEVREKLKDDCALSALWFYLGLPSFQKITDEFYKESKIIVSPEHVSALMEWLPTKFTTLRYIHSKDKNVDYRQKCAKVKNTIVLYQSSNGYVFGGYNSASWENPRDYRRAENAFIFTLTNPNNLPPTKYDISKNRNKISTAVFADNGVPAFGGGHDLCSSYSGFPNSYIDTSGYGNRTFTGSYQHTISEYEIWEIN